MLAHFKKEPYNVPKEPYNDIKIALQCFKRALHAHRKGTEMGSIGLIKENVLKEAYVLSMGTDTHTDIDTDTSIHKGTDIDTDTDTDADTRIYTPTDVDTDIHMGAHMDI